MPESDVFDLLRAQMQLIATGRAVGRIISLGRNAIAVSGLDHAAALGDRVRFGRDTFGEILGIGAGLVRVMPEGPADGLRLDDEVCLIGAPAITPHVSWLGRVIDPNGLALDGRPLISGARSYPLIAPPPPPTRRRGLGARLRTGHAVFDTFLPLTKGQRLGLFAGSGVGKSRLIAALAQELEADVVVISLIGERGREVRDFVVDTLGPEGLARTVVVAATSDQPAPTRARAAYAMMSVAEYFRDLGRNVLILADSLTRFAEAQRDIAVVAGEPLGPSGFPASMAQSIMSLAERAGPGAGKQGDITAVFSVLVAGSDMEGPVADVTRGVLDGHVVLTREITERGRFPAVDVLQSVSRALPDCASPEENHLITRARQVLSVYDKAEIMVQTGLYTPGADPATDNAIKIWPELDVFIGRTDTDDPADSFAALDKILAPGNTSDPTTKTM